MANDPKQIIEQTIEGGVNSDFSNQKIPNNQTRTQLNIRPYALGNVGIGTNIPGNTLISNTLPSGNNYAIGWGKNEETGKFYVFIYNDEANHGIYAYDQLTQSLTPVLLNLTDTNNIDILKFSKDYLINHVDIVDDKLIYWVDGLNKARKFNINKAIDKSITGYGTVITEDFITAYKQTGVFAPAVIYFTDLMRTSNYLYALQFKFAYVFYYDDGEISNVSDLSAVALPPNESYLGASAITFSNNGIQITVETGNRLVTKIQILVKINQQPFVSCVVLNKAQLGIIDYGSYIYNFYNDGAYITFDPLKVIRPYSFLPRIPYVQSFVKVAMTYGHFEEGFASVQVKGSVSISFIPFYLPNGTVSQLNNPSITTNLLSTDHHGGLFNSWYTTVTHFIIGEDVKKGNLFVVNVYGGNGGDAKIFPASITDTATTIASAIKQWLRTIDAAGTGLVSNEATDGSGNVSWDFTIEAHEGRNAITFSGAVNPVNYSTLLDNGLSINTIKQGSSRKYGIVYEDDDGRTSLAYTTDSFLTVTPFETETVLGQTTPIGLQQPIHTITITNKPPIWAKYYRIVRTSDTNTFIQLLIQQVNTVAIANEDTYLDLVVGSLFTYQKIHPDTILKYEFERGDRLRLVSKYDVSTELPSLLSPFFETEVLDYKDVTTEFVNANITIDGTAEIAVGKAVDANYIGKYIVINEVERLITGISGAKYVVDFPIEPNLNYETGANTSTTYPNYTFIDRRGIVRIKLPPASYGLTTPSQQLLVEIYRPQNNLNNLTYLNFNDFQMKFNISDWGTPNAAHVGNINNSSGTPNQDPTDPINIPAIVQVTNGDAYVRNRALPTNNQDPNPQVIIDQICDPNFSDFYESALYNTGRVYPQDQAYGVVGFTQRERFSNNYIQDTQINGLNDFDNTDRKDYNDQYGPIALSRFRNGVLYLFKQLKTTWTPVNRNIIIDNSGSSLLGTTKELLNDLQYADIEGGIGDNGESWAESNGYMYAAYANEGIFVRIAQDGTIAISTIYLFDERAREILSDVSKHNLKIFGGFDKTNTEVLWSVQDYTPFIFNNAFNAGDWQTILNSYPDGTVYAITQQPANSTATIVDGQIQITNTSILGNDMLQFQGTLPDSSLTPIINFCFQVISNPAPVLSWIGDNTTLYCLQESSNNTGEQSFQVLDQIDLSSGTLTGLIMPNISLIDPLGIISNTNAITFNTTDITPSGGTLNDIWYNQPSDTLYKNIGAGIWQLLTNKVINAYYLSPVENTVSCPLGFSTLSFKFSTLSADVCTKTSITVYAISGTTDISVGLALFIDSALSTPVSGFDFVVANSGEIYNIDSSTGIVDTDTGITCALASIFVSNSSAINANVGVYTASNVLVVSFTVNHGASQTRTIPSGSYTVKVTVFPTVSTVSVTINSDTKTAAVGFATILTFHSEATNITGSIH